MSVRLVGRAAELEQVRTLFASGREPAAAIVLGDPGIGKSRLAAEAAHEVRLPVFRVVGHEPERLVPLAAVSHLLRALASVPEHGAVLDEIAFRATGGTEPVRLFEAAHKALTLAGPALILVDDVQWVDDLSLALVHYLLRAAASSGAPLRLLAAGRRVDRSLVFAEDVRRLLEPSGTVVVELRPLDAHESLELALGLAPGLRRADAVLLCERSAGIPFWIETLARSGGARVDAGRLLTARLRDAGPDAGALVAVLAVVGRPLAGEDAAALLGWASERLEAAADDLVSRGVARRAAGRLTFSHDLLREAASEELPERRSRELHRRVADWLEQAADDDLSLLREALEHRVATGQQPFELAARLVSSRQRRRLGGEGLQVLARLADEADLSTPEGQSLRAGVAGLAFELGEHAAALARWTDLAPLLAQPAARFDALLGASRAAFELGWAYARRAHELLADAVACAASEEALVAARAHQARILLWLDHRTADGAAIAREALTRSRSLGAGPGQRRVRLEALQAARQAAMQEADGEEILRLAEEMIALTRDWSEDAYVDALLARADGQFRTGPLTRGEATMRSALELATRRTLPLQTADAGLALAITLHDKGSLDEAERTAAAAEEVAARLDRVMPSRLIAHELALVRGDVEEGLREYLAAVERRPDPHVRIIPRHFAANFLSRAGRGHARDNVVSLLANAREDAAAAGCPRCTVELQVFAASALARVGCHAEAEAQLTQAEKVPPRDALNRYLRLYARALVTATRDTARGAAMLEEVCTEADRLERRLDLLWARVDLACVVAAGDRERAADSLREVGAAADSIGAVAPLRVAEQELRAIGVRTWRRGPSRGGSGTLSEREREIAALVARGASNPEIARALFLSRKTVEHHVSHAMRKLGARNRAELAARFANAPVPRE